MDFCGRQPSPLGPGQPFGMYYKFLAVSQDSADVVYRSADFGVLEKRMILSLQTVLDGQAPGYPPEFMEHYPAINEYRCYLSVQENCWGARWWRVGLEIDEFWTDGTDFYFRAGKAPVQPDGEPEPGTYSDPIWYSDLVLYTELPVSTETTTWGHIKSMMH